MPNEFLNSTLGEEIYNLLKQLNIQVRKDSAAGPCLALEGIVRTSNGNACALSIQDDEFPDSNIVEIRDEMLLEKLRSVKGQLGHQGLPVFYYEHLFGHKVTAIKAQSPRFLYSLSPRIAEIINKASPTVLEEGKPNPKTWAEVGFAYYSNIPPAR